MSTHTTDRPDTAGAAAQQEVVVRCPATTQVVGSVPVSTAAEVEAVAARLRKAQPLWQQMSVDAARGGWASGATGCWTTATSS
jgi:acyl-CoA reductase-like NAD-dependent aldehyde dehydrogenase